MPVQATVLLVSINPPSPELLHALEASGLYVEVAHPETFEDALKVVSPDLVVHVGERESSTVLRRLATRSEAPRAFLALVVEPGFLPEARTFDRRIVLAVLGMDLPWEALAERVISLARRAASGATSSLPAVPPAPPRAVRRVAIVDQDVTRADAVATALRDRALHVHLAQADPAWTRWSLLRRFAPELLIVDEDASPSEEWFRKQGADDQLAHVPVRRISYGALFDASSGSVRLNLLLTSLGLKEPLPSPVAAPNSEPEPDSDDDRPTLLFDEEAERPTLMADDVSLDDDRPTLVADEESERPTLFAGSEQEPPTPAAVGSAGAKVAQPRKPLPTVRIRRPRADKLARPGQLRSKPSLLLPIVAGAALLGALSWWLLHRADAGDDASVSPARTITEPSQGRLDPALPASASPDPKAPRDSSPWEAPENPDIESCELLAEARDQPSEDITAASRHWEKARQALVLGDLLQARTWMCQAVFSHSESRAAEGLAESYLFAGAPREAKRWIDVAMQQRPERRKTIELLGDIENQLGDLEASTKAWARALKVSPDDRRTLSLLARGYLDGASAAMRAKDWGRAEILYRRAATLNREDADAVVGLARIAMALERPDRAALWLAEAIDRKPAFPPAIELQQSLASTN